MGAPPPEMRIELAPDGHVQLAVSLATSFDPALVAGVVSAVRHGIVYPSSSSSLTPPAVSVRERVRRLDGVVSSATAAQHREFASSPALARVSRPDARGDAAVAARTAAAATTRLSERNNSLPGGTPLATGAGASAGAGASRRGRRLSSLGNSSSSRSLSDLTQDSPRAAATAMDDAAVVPSSPYVRAASFNPHAVEHEQQAPQEEDEEDDVAHEDGEAALHDAWDAVEYVATDEYEQHVNRVHHIGRREHVWHTGARNVPLRPNAWRLLASFASLRSKRSALDAVQQPTLANAAPSLSSPRAEVPKRIRARTLFSRGKEGMVSEWMEFSSSMGVERILAEVANILKSLQYEVWRRAGENKLRCIRSISESHQMHVVVVVGCVAVPRTSVSVVRLRRAKGDRNRTEMWRFQVLFREIVHRLRTSGVDVRSEQS
eukprot:TRINITY_DN1617_c0_g1_i1.p1 TRINITY_DN1617_c0_g1~~TRINITY_DN1617_c0_g1_i1.p1  ORF type:complete len:433 (+),score=89.69 TRINITY_DN1617_c0_g1_i1:1586-2884(+)